MMAFVSSDGEKLQVDTFIEPASVILLNNSLIFEAKHAASYSAKGNAWDAGKYFMATKKRGKTLIQSQFMALSQPLRRVLDDDLSLNKPNICREKRNHIVDSICRTVIACQKTLTMDIIQDGFSSTGQYVNRLKFAGFDFDKKISCCTNPPTKSEMKVLREQFKPMVELFRAQGHLTEGQMDVAGIPKMDDGRKIHKNDRSIHQNRSLVLNVERNLQRFNANPVPLLLTSGSRKNERFLAKEVKKKKPTKQTKKRVNEFVETNKRPKRNRVRHLDEDFIYPTIAEE
jgi:hypothetical protein